MDNGVLSETKTLVFFIFSPVKICKNYVPNIPDVRSRLKTFSRQFLSLVCTKYGFRQRFGEIFKRKQEHLFVCNFSIV